MAKKPKAKTSRPDNKRENTGNKGSRKTKFEAPASLLKTKPSQAAYSLLKKPVGTK